MNFLKTKSLLAFICAAGLAMPVAAQQSGSQQKSQQSSQNQEQGQRQQGGKQQKQQGGQAQGKTQQKRVATLSGRVQDLRMVNLDGEGQKHVLAKIQLSNNKTAVVDLGTRDDIQSLRPRKGQSLTVLGRPGRINGKPVIVADQARDTSTPDAVIMITRLVPVDIRFQQSQQGGQQGQSQARQQANRYRQLVRQAIRQGNEQQAQRYAQQANRYSTVARRQEQQSGGSASSGQSQQQRQQSDAAAMSGRSGQSQQQAPRMIIGQVADLRDVQFKGLPDRHKLVKLQTNQGQTVIVDLGADGKLTDIDLQKGETVVAVGAFGRVNGKPVLVATHVADVVEIERQQQKQQQKGGDGQSQQTAGRQPAGAAQQAGAQQQSGEQPK